MKFGRNYNVRNVCDWMGFDYRQDYANCCCSYLEQTLESPELGTLTSGSCEWQTQGHTWCVCGWWWWWQRQSQGRNFDTTESNHFFFSLLSFNLLMWLKKVQIKVFPSSSLCRFPPWVGRISMWCVVVHQKPEVALEIERKYTAAATAPPLSPIGYCLSSPIFNKQFLYENWLEIRMKAGNKKKKKKKRKRKYLVSYLFPFSKISISILLELIYFRVLCCVVCVWVGGCAERENLAETHTSDGKRRWSEPVLPGCRHHRRLLVPWKWTNVLLAPLWYLNDRNSRQCWW